MKKVFGWCLLLFPIVFMIGCVAFFCGIKVAIEALLFLVGTALLVSCMIGGLLLLGD